jgi:hypothetical protein
MDRDGTVLPDGQHQLLVYKVEDQARFKDPAVSYLQLPYPICRRSNHFVDWLIVSVLRLFPAKRP